MLTCGFWLTPEITVWRRRVFVGRDRSHVRTSSRVGARGGAGAPFGKPAAVLSEIFGMGKKGGCLRSGLRDAKRSASSSSSGIAFDWMVSALCSPAPQGGVRARQAEPAKSCVQVSILRQTDRTAQTCRVAVITRSGKTEIKILLGLVALFFFENRSCSRDAAICICRCGIVRNVRRRSN